MSAGRQQARTDGGTPEIVAFIAERDSAYVATSNAIGQPYVQHRGGPPGFIKVFDNKTVAFADYVGNRQYITTGNLVDKDGVCLFLMNYASRERVKIWGRARVVAGDEALFKRVADQGYVGRVEQAIIVDVSAWDANCSQHISRLVHFEAVENERDVFQKRIAYVEMMLRDAKVPFALEDDSSSFADDA